MELLELLCQHSRDVKLMCVMSKLCRSWCFVFACLVALIATQPILPVSAAQGNQSGSDQASPGIQVESERFQAVIDCLPPELGMAQSDAGGRIAQVFSEWGKDQFERIFGMKKDPQLTLAEQKFEACLEDKGIAPMRKLQQAG